MHPDGGIGRFRAYGKVLPSPSPSSPSSPSDDAVDLAYVLNGATVVGESDQHFGRGGNLILPGRGADMGDGWETKRSRGRLGTGKGDWVVIRLGEAGYVEWVDLDTNHFVGNFPNSASVSAIRSAEELPAHGDAGWTEVLAETKMGPHRQHFFQLEHRDEVWTHLRLNIFPDGGVKRVRAYGRPASKVTDPKSLAPLPSPATFLTKVKDAVLPSSAAAAAAAPASATSSVPKIPALPLTPDAFSAYGSVIQSYPDHRSARKDIVIKPVNFGTAHKFNHLAPVAWVPPPAGFVSDVAPLRPEVNFCVFRCDAQPGVVNAAGKEQWEVRVLERHEFSSQAFVPMGGGGGRYLVLVALPGADGKPDLATLRAFVATSAQGISYAPNVWHHPLIALEKVTDFACVVHETGVGRVDCEIVEFGGVVAVVEEV